MYQQTLLILRHVWLRYVPHVKQCIPTCKTKPVFLVIFLHFFMSMDTLYCVLAGHFSSHQHSGSVPFLVLIYLPDNPLYRITRMANMFMKIVFFFPGRFILWSLRVAMPSRKKTLTFPIVPFHGSFLQRKAVLFKLLNWRIYSINFYAFTRFLFQHVFWTCGSMTFWGGSGSGSADPCLLPMDPDLVPDPRSGSFYFRHWPSRCQQKQIFSPLWLFEATFTSFFKDKNSKRVTK